LLFIHHNRLADRAVIFSSCPFIRPRVRWLVSYPTCKRDILKINELILMPVGVSSPQSKGMQQSTSAVSGQRSRPREAKYRSGGPAEASLSTPSVEQLFSFVLFLSS